MDDDQDCNWNTHCQFRRIFGFNEAQTKHLSSLCLFLSQLRFGFNWIANDRSTKGLHDPPIKGLHEPLPHFHSPGTLESILAIKRLILKETVFCFTKSMKETNINLSTKFLIMYTGPRVSKADLKRVVENPNRPRWCIVIAMDWNIKLHSTERHLLFLATTWGLPRNQLKEQSTSS